MDIDYPNYIIFLPDKCFVKSKWSFFNNSSLPDKLKNMGILVISNLNIKDFITCHSNYLYNDIGFPNLNTLYIHLFNGIYYSDNLFSIKKLEKEREIIFLLSGKLGVSEIKYKIETSTITIKSLELSTNMQNIDFNTKFEKSISNSTDKSYIEKYSNRGAPIYTTSITLKQVEDNIRQQFKILNPSVFSYNFYLSNDNLRTFVFKRFNFKMKSLNYSNETEDIFDKCIEVKLLLINFGIGLKFKSYIYNMQKITYDMFFFEDKELRIELDRIIQLNEDPFYQVREIYNDMENKNLAVNLIKQYVREYANNCKYYIKEQDTEFTFNEKMNKWIDNNQEEFIKLCHSFISSYQIETWIMSNLKLSDNEYFKKQNKNYNVYGINKLKEKNYERYKRKFLDIEDSSTHTNDIIITDSESEDDINDHPAYQCCQL